MYDTYLTTNPGKTVLYTGMTNDLAQRMLQYYLQRGTRKTFAGRYYCFHLLYYESYTLAGEAIRWEKEIKGWLRAKKVALIARANPEWQVLNPQIMRWPPYPEQDSQSENLD